MSTFIDAPELHILKSLEQSDLALSAEGGSRQGVRLESVTIFDSNSGYEPFLLTVSGSANMPLASGIYRLDHSVSGPFDAFLQPVQKIGGAADRSFYEIHFNRVSKAGTTPGSGQQKPSRRNFLGRMAATVAGVGLMGGFSTIRSAEGRGTISGGESTTAGSDPYIAEIVMFAGNFAPSGWSLCQGQLIPISQNTALFSLLGTTYGGNGTTNFALPDLQGRAPIGFGQGPGLSSYTLGQTGGAETVALTSNQIPLHSHTTSLPVSSAEGNATSPAGNILAAQPDSRGTVPVYSTNVPDGTMVVSNASAGGGQAHSNMQPYLVVTYIIALQGIFPPRL